MLKTGVVILTVSFAGLDSCNNRDFVKVSQGFISMEECLEEAYRLRTTYDDVNWTTCEEKHFEVKNEN